MFEARIFNSNDSEIVTAQDVFDGKVSREREFIDVEYDFRVTYVGGAKNNGKPHFRLYFSLEDYNKWSPEKQNRWQILAHMRHFAETKWHMDWKDKFSSFTSIEKRIKDNEIKQYRIADALYEEEKLCIEFQHSFIAHDFEERNEFYRKQGYKSVWLYDLTNSNVKKQEDSSYQILENNAKGFFRIAEYPPNLKDNPIFIQAKDNNIYWIDELKRKEINTELKSTIRYFYPKAIYSETQFISMIKNKQFSFMSDENDGLSTVWDLWNDSCQTMFIENKETGDQMMIYRDKASGQIKRQFDGGITYKKIIFHSNGRYEYINKNYHSLETSIANKKIWKILGGFYI